MEKKVKHMVILGFAVVGAFSAIAWWMNRNAKKSTTVAKKKTVETPDKTVTTETVTKETPKPEKTSGVGGEPTSIGGGCFACRFADGTYLAGTICSTDSAAAIQAFVNNCDAGNGTYYPVRPRKAARR